jgi:hypothetical protein
LSRLKNANIGHQFSAECNPPIPARKAMFILFGLPGTGVVQFQ